MHLKLISFFLLYVKLHPSLDVDVSVLCVYVIWACVVQCVKQRHVSPVKAVALSGAEGGSEAWKHSWHLADLYWTFPRSDTSFTRTQQSLSTLAWSAEPVTWCPGRGPSAMLSLPWYINRIDAELFSFFTSQPYRYSFAWFNPATLHLWKHLHELIEKKGSRIRSKGKMNQTKDNMCNWHYQDVIGGLLFVLPSQTLATSFIQTVSCCFFKIPHDNRWPEAMSASVCESSVMSRQIVFKSGLLLPDSTGQRCFLPTSNRCTIPMNLFFLLRFTLQKLHSSVNEGYYLVCK